MILEFLRIENARLRLDDMTGELAHFLRQLELRYFLEIAPASRTS